MKKILLAAAAGLFMSGAAFAAEPMNVAQLDTVTAGTCSGICRSVTITNTLKGTLNTDTKSRVDVKGFTAKADAFADAVTPSKGWGAVTFTNTESVAVVEGKKVYTSSASTSMAAINRTGY